LETIRRDDRFDPAADRICGYRRWGTTFARSCCIWAASGIGDPLTHGWTRPSVTRPACAEWFADRPVATGVATEPRQATRAGGRQKALVLRYSANHPTPLHPTGKPRPPRKAGVEGSNPSVGLARGVPGACAHRPVWASQSPRSQPVNCSCGRTLLPGNSSPRATSARESSAPNLWLARASLAVGARPTPPRRLRTRSDVEVGVSERLCSVQR
jgi:hypothetical protein